MRDGRVPTPGIDIGSILNIFEGIRYSGSDTSHRYLWQKKIKIKWCSMKFYISQVRKVSVPGIGKDSQSDYSHRHLSKEKKVISNFPKR